MVKLLNIRMDLGPRIIICFGLFAVYIYTVIYAREKTAAALSVSDWLINYGAGFVRRGSIGSVIVFIKDITGLTPEFLVVIIKAICYGILYMGTILQVVSSKQLKLVDSLVLISPATFIFPLIDGLGSGRKEILLLALFVLFGWFRLKEKTGVYLLSLIFLFLTSIHEGLFFFLPLWLLIYLKEFSVQKLEHWVIGLSPSLLLIICLILFSNKVDEGFLLKMVATIDPLNPQYWNTGAIPWLKFSSIDGVFGVVDAFSIWSVPSVLAGIGIFLLPIYISTKNLNYSFGFDKLSLLLVLFCQLPVFLVATDWGRWFYIDATMLAITYLNERNINSNIQFSDVSFRPFLANIMMVCLLFINSSVWRVSHCCDVILTLQKLPRMILGINK